jgi:ribosome small subunit-dependent GTPase A
VEQHPKDQLREHLLRSFGKRKSYGEKLAQRQASKARRAMRQKPENRHFDRRPGQQDEEEAEAEELELERKRQRKLAAAPSPQELERTRTAASAESGSGRQDKGKQQLTGNQQQLPDNSEAAGHSTGHAAGHATGHAAGHSAGNKAGQAAAPRSTEPLDGPAPRAHQPGSQARQNASRPPLCHQTPGPGPAGPNTARRAQVIAIQRKRLRLALWDPEAGEPGQELELAVEAKDLAVGDWLLIVTPAGPGSERLERLPRSSVLERPDPGQPERRLALAANADICCIVVAAAEPGFKPAFVERLLLAAEHGGLAGLVVVNKIDLCTPKARAELEAKHEDANRPGGGRSAPWLLCSAQTGEGLAELARHLSGRTTVVVGHSGVGKSSLLNALDPCGQRRANAVRASDGKGRHTTTSGSLRRLPGGGALIDTPGVRQFALSGLSLAELQLYFGDFGGQPPCRFRDCQHLSEPGCQIQAAVAAGRLPAQRLSLWQRLLSEIRSPPQKRP